MSKIFLTRSGNEITWLHLGTWSLAGWFAGDSSSGQAAEILNAARLKGINAFDTAPVYGFGTGERLISTLTDNAREEIWITTKAGLRWDTPDEGVPFFSWNSHGREFNVRRNLKYNSIIEECEYSLGRMKTDYIDLLLLHWPDPSTNISESLKAFKELKQNKKVRYFGLSNHGVESMVRWKREFSGLPLSFTQNRFNILQQKARTNIIPYCQRNKVQFISYSPLAQGVLAGQAFTGDNLPDADPRKGSGLRSAERLRLINEKLSKWDDLQAKYSADLSSLALAWTHSKDTPFTVAGISKLEQIDSLIKTMEIKLEQNDRLRMSDVMRDFQYEGK